LNFILPLLEQGNSQKSKKSQGEDPHGLETKKAMGFAPMAFLNYRDKAHKRILP